MSTWLMYVLTIALTIAQAFDVISTNLVISKGRGHEANGLIAKWMGITGQWWWIIKLPLVAYIWYWATQPNPTAPSLIVMALILAVYGYVLWNNYRIAWRLK